MQGFGGNLKRRREDGFEWKDVKMGEDESPAMLRRMGKEGADRWVTRED